MTATVFVDTNVLIYAFDEGPGPLSAVILGFSNCRRRENGRLSLSLNRRFATRAGSWWGSSHKPVFGRSHRHSLLSSIAKVPKLGMDALQL